MGYHPVIVSVEQLPSYFSSHSMDTPYHLFLKFIPYVCVFGCCASSWVLSFLIRIPEDETILEKWFFFLGWGRVKHLLCQWAECT